jgi:hypothetical protein
MLPVSDTWPIDDGPNAPRSFHRPELISPGRWRLSTWSRMHRFVPRTIYAPASL